MASSGGNSGGYTNQSNQNGYSPWMSAMNSPSMSTPSGSSGTGMSSGYTNQSSQNNPAYANMFSGAANNSGGNWGGQFLQMLMGGNSGNPYLNLANQIQIRIT